MWLRGWLSSQLFKVIVDRQRPNPALLFDPLSPETGSNSFPSGHVALAVGLAWAFYFLLRKTHWARPVWCWPSSYLLWWRGLGIYVGVHYPSDVAASFLAASAAVMLFVGVWNLFRGAFAAHPSLVHHGPLRTAGAFCCCHNPPIEAYIETRRARTSLRRWLLSLTRPPS